MIVPSCGRGLRRPPCVAGPAANGHASVVAPVCEPPAPRAHVGAGRGPSGTPSPVNGEASSTWRIRARSWASSIAPTRTSPAQRDHVVTALPGAAGIDGGARCVEHRTHRREARRAPWLSWPPLRRDLEPPPFCGGPEDLVLERELSDLAFHLFEPSIGRIPAVGPGRLQALAAVLQEAVAPRREPVRFDLKLARELIQRLPTQQAQDRIHLLAPTSGARNGGPPPSRSASPYRSGRASSSPVSQVSNETGSGGLGLMRSSQWSG